MKKAIHIGYNEMFEKKCGYVADAGFKYVAVNFTKVLDKTEYEWDKITDTIGEVLSKNSVECIQSHPYYYDLRLSSEITEEKYEFAIKQAIKASGILGAKWCAIHPRTSISSGYLTSRSLQDNRKAIEAYLEYAYKYNTGIAVENLPVFHGIVPVMPFYSSNFEDLCTLVDKINDDRVGICWDTGHANLMSFDQADAVRFVGDRLKCTHIHNNFKNADDHLTPDTGNIDWKSVMNAMANIEYDGALALETQDCYSDDDLFQSFARHNYACLEYLERGAR